MFRCVVGIAKLVPDLSKPPFRYSRGPKEEQGVWCEVPSGQQQGQPAGNLSHDPAHCVDDESCEWQSQPLVLTDQTGYGDRPAVSVVALFQVLTLPFDRNRSLMHNVGVRQMAVVQR